MQRDGNGRERKRFSRIDANDNPGSKVGPEVTNGNAPEKEAHDR